MTKKELINHIGKWYRAGRDEETGEYDINDYDWESGCYHNGHWVCLRDFYDCVVELLNNKGILDD